MRAGSGPIIVFALVACSEGAPQTRPDEDAGQTDAAHADGGGPDAASGDVGEARDAEADGGVDLGASDADTHVDASDASAPPEPVRALVFDDFGSLELSAHLLVHDARGRLVTEVEGRPPVELNVPEGGGVTRVVDGGFQTEVYFESILGVEPGDELVFGSNRRSGPVRETPLRFSPLPGYTHYSVDAGDCYVRTRSDDGPLTEIRLRLFGRACSDESTVLAQASGVGLEPRFSWRERVPTPVGTHTATVVMPDWQPPDAEVDVEGTGFAEPFILGPTTLQLAFASGDPVGALFPTQIREDDNLRTFAYPAVVRELWLDATAVDRQTNRNRQLRKRLDTDNEQVELNFGRDFLPFPEVLELSERRGQMRTAWVAIDGETPDAYRVQVYWPPIDPFGERDFSVLFTHWTVVVPGTTTQIATPEVPNRYREFATFDVFAGADVGVVAWDGRDYGDVKRTLGTDWREGPSQANRRLDGEYRLSR